MPLSVKDIFGVLKARFKVGAMAHIGDAVLGIAVLAQGWAFDLTMRRAGVDIREWVLEQVRQIRDAGFVNFGMNLLFAENDRLDEDVDLILEIRPGWVTISALTDPRGAVEYIRRLKAAGIYVGVLIGSLKQLNMILKYIPAELLPDFFVLEGRESGGHNGPCSLLELLQTVLPVIKKLGIVVGAAGAIGNAEMAAALFALGIDFIQIGSPLVISEECSAHPDCKKAICSANTTVQTGGGEYMHAVRTIPTPGALTLLRRANNGMAKKKFLNLARGTIPRGLLLGDPNGVMLIGEGVVALKKVRPVATILAEFEVPEEVA